MNEKQLLLSMQDAASKLNNYLDEIHELGYEIIIKVSQRETNNKSNYKRPMIEVDAMNQFVNQV